MVGEAGAALPTAGEAGNDGHCLNASVHQVAQLTERELRACLSRRSDSAMTDGRRISMPFQLRGSTNNAGPSTGFTFRGMLV
jgi:hypothetical protein